MRKILLAIILTVSVIPAIAQVSVEARIDSIEMFIGEQVHVTLTVTAKESSKVDMPAFKPKEIIIPGVEVLGCVEAETKILDNGLSARNRVYTLTSFDEQLYYLPPFKVKVDGKVYKSKSLAMKVLGVEVDTTNVDQFFDPKDVQDNPFLWSDWSMIFWMSLLMLLFIVMFFLLYLQFRANKPINISIKVVKRLLPHQKAMKEIELIKADRMVQSENQKEYYTKLTDTLRKYIRERYGFNAMEMTSGEIIERLMASHDRAAIEELKELFNTADLVKFAKYSTLINENDKNLVSAIEFINSTKVENLPSVEIVKPYLTEDEKLSVKMRRVLKIAIGIVAAVCIALFVWILYCIWQLVG